MPGCANPDIRRKSGFQGRLRRLFSILQLRVQGVQVGRRRFRACRRRRQRPSGAGMGGIVEDAGADHQGAVFRPTAPQIHSTSTPDLGTRRLFFKERSGSRVEWI